MNIIDAAIQNNVKKVIALSTDKACNPVNLYGATKLCSDKLFVAENNNAGARQTKFCVVRYGNVLGSRGSVIPFFQERARTGVLPITDSEMTWFWITLDQAVHFVISCLSRAKGGEIFCPQDTIDEDHGLGECDQPRIEAGGLGIRPGEKIHETLISEDEARNTIQFKECYLVQPNLELRDELLAGCNGNAGKLCTEGFRYSSDNNSDWLKVDELRKLVDKVADDYLIEKSRWSMEDVPE